MLLSFVVKFSIKCESGVLIRTKICWKESIKEISQILIGKMTYGRSNINVCVWISIEYKYKGIKYVSEERVWRNRLWQHDTHVA